MTWTKLGDEFPDDAADLSDAAFRTHVEALAWSNRRLLDLLVPKRDLRRFAFSDSADLVVPELIKAGWWEEHGEYWWIGCRYPQWQQDRAQVQDKRDRDAERQRRKRKHDRGDHAECLPQNCPAARMSRATSRRDPGRDGTGQENYSPTEVERRR
jgi:hypothetical protein